MDYNINLVPSIAVAIVMLYTGIIWLITRKKEIRMDSRIMAWTLIVEGITYAYFGQYMEFSLVARVINLRSTIILICLSQSLPLTVSYIRSLHSDATTRYK